MNKESIMNKRGIQPNLIEKISENILAGGLNIPLLILQVIFHKKKNIVTEKIEETLSNFTIEMKFKEQKYK